MSPRENQRHGPHVEAVTAGRFDETFCRRFLITYQNPDGGWGYHPFAPSSVEATAWALMALPRQEENSPAGDAGERGCDWLRQAQLKDGSWPAFPGQSQGSWVTSLASLALHGQGVFPEAVARGRDWLLDDWPAEGSLRWRLGRMWSAQRVVRQDNSLRGWSWTPHTASWVEPTAHALLFLGSLMPDMLPAKAAKRRRLAEGMLLDRKCPGGGWNSGNPLVYGVPGLPSVGPTSWALLALAHSAKRTETQSSLDWLERACLNLRGAASLALAHRCLKAYGRRVSPLEADLVDLYLHNRFFDSVLTAAWIALALEEEMGRAGAASTQGVPL